MLSKQAFFIYSILLSLAGFTARSQTNLVPNPGFETYTLCPSNFAEMSVTGNWYSPTLGSPDYFNSCDSYWCDIPANPCGYQAVRVSGFGYSGLVTYSGGSNTIYREYIQTHLSTTLTAGQRYYFSMYVSLADSSGFSADGMGVHLSSTDIKMSGANPAASANFMVIPQISNSLGLLTNSTGWTKIEGSFVAVGDEEYMTIGNFKNNNNTNAQVRTNSATLLNKYAYYYIDDICLSTSWVTCEVDQAVGISGYAFGGAPVFYYSPASRSLVVENTPGDYTIKITNLVGTTVKIINESTAPQTDVSELPPGCYFISVNTTNASVVKKVIIE